MNKVKSYYITILGSIVSFIGLWFYLEERNYANNSRACMRNAPCLAEVLQWIGISTLLTGISIIIISLLLKEK